MFRYIPKTDKSADILKELIRNKEYNFENEEAKKKFISEEFEKESYSLTFRAHMPRFLVFIEDMIRESPEQYDNAPIASEFIQWAMNISELLGDKYSEITCDYCKEFLERLKLEKDEDLMKEEDEIMAYEHEYGDYEDYEEYEEYEEEGMEE